MSKTKPFIIPKDLVVEAYKLVKSNAGAAGVDQQSLKEFDKSLKDNLILLPFGRHKEESYTRKKHYNSGDSIDENLR